MARGSLRDKQSGVQVVWNGDEVKARAIKLAQKSSFEIGLDVEGTAKRLCPVDTGRLLGSIMVKSGLGMVDAPENGEKQIQAPTDAFETFVGSSVDYAAYMEYGTIKTSAQPYLRPALDLAKGRAPQIVQIGAKKEFGDYLHPKDQWKQSPEGFTE